MAVLALLIISQTGHSTIIWQENFDGFTRDYNCSLDDCALNPGLPSGYVAFGSNVRGKNYGRPNAQIVAGAERSNPGQTNKRAFRINLEEDSWPTGDNVLTKDLGKNYTRIYLRWYQRDSVKSFGNFQKLFRLKQSDGQILIPEFQVNGGNIQMNLWDRQTASNHFFTGYNLNTQYTANTWVCYEIKIDLVNKQAEFWVNGVSKGTLNATWWPSGWYIRYVQIGGNQYGHSWIAPTEHTRDYDDIVIADSYVGPSGVSAAEVPAPANLRVVN
ncbi:MAG: hypothetical protein H6Q52_904 [Deltaproteobacteria bacterium]|nr:hypothetical protein [Deltaproteobacteria bacterium]